MIGGVHQSILSTQGSGLIMGTRSHTPLDYELTPNLFFVGDHRLPEDLFFKMEHDSGKLSFEVFTRDLEHPSRRRHPDLFARQLFDRSIEYFEDIHGAGTIRKLAAWWQRGHDNYFQFSSARNRYEIYEPAEQDRRAAFATWTGAQAVRHAFTEIDGKISRRHKGRDIKLTFARPTVNKDQSE